MKRVDREKLKPEKGAVVRGKLGREQAAVVVSHLRNMVDAQKGLQQYLEGIGVRPIGGWKDPKGYSLVKGIRLVASDCDECTECSIVCIDDSCDCTVECSQGVIVLDTPDPESKINVEGRIDLQNVQRVPRTGLNVYVKRTR